MACTLNSNCTKYLPDRRFEDFDDLPNPFITQTNNSDCKECENDKCVYAISKKNHNDLTFIVLCFLIFVLLSKLF